MDAVDRLVKLAVAATACSGIVDVLCCDTIIESPGTSVGELGFTRLGRIEPMKDNDVDHEAVGKFEIPARCEELVVAGGAPMLPTNDGDWSPLLEEKETDKLR